MHFKKKLLSLLLIGGLLAGALLGSKMIAEKEESPAETAFAAKDTLYFWYADDSLTDYLTNVSASYYEQKGIHVIPVLHSGLEYLEEINDASVHPGEGVPQQPDMYILTNDSLEKAYLAGLAAPIQDYGSICNENTFPQTALDAVSYQGKYVAYPLYYETSALLYNKTYIENAEKKVPETVDGILTFADEYDAPEQVEAVFKWDVSDIFYNYYIVGNYMIVGGETGDDPEQIDIANVKARKCLEIYQNLNQFFSIDTKEVTYDSVLQEFIDGKVVMTVVTSDAIAKMEEAKATGKFAYEYGIAKMPDLTEVLKGRSLSVTNGIVINGYSEKAEIANDFAAFLIDSYAEELYKNTGKIPSRYGVSHENENLETFMAEYEKSISMPKMLGTGNFWVQLEICFSKIWTGADIVEELVQLKEKMEKQVE